MKKRNMLTKVAALSMAGLLTIGGLPTAGLGGLMSVEAADNDIEWSLGSTYETQAKYGDKLELGHVQMKSDASATITAGYVTESPSVVMIENGVVIDSVADKGLNDEVSFYAGGTGNSKVVTGTVTTSSLAASGSSALTVASIAKRNINNDDTYVEIGVAKSNGTAKVTGAYTDNNADLSEDFTTDYRNEGYAISIESVYFDAEGVTKALNAKAGMKIVAMQGSTTVDSGATVHLSNAGTYRLAIDATANTNMTGTRYFDLTIGSVALANDDVTVNMGTDASKTYDVNLPEFNKGATPITIDVNATGDTITSSGYVLTNDSTELVDAKEKGTVSLKIKNSTGYSGTVEGEYTVNAKTVVDSIATSAESAAKAAPGTYSVIIPEVLEDGSVQLNNQADASAPTITVYDATELDESSPLYNNDSNLVYTDSSKVDHKFAPIASDNFTVDADSIEGKTGETNHVDVDFSGNYYGTITLAFDIVASTNIITEDNTTIEMKYSDPDAKSAVTVVDGDEITYFGDTIKKNLKVNTRLVDAKGNKVTGGITWDVTNGTDVGVATIKVIGTGKWAGTITRTLNIVPRDLADKKTTITPKSTAKKYYDGTAQTYLDANGDNEIDVYNKVGSTVKALPLKEGEDYDVTYDNNIKAGTASLIVEGKGNYTGKASYEFAINKYNIKTNKDGSTVRFSVDSIPNQVYTGEEIKPEITATFLNADGTKTTLVKDEDYTLAYSKNINTGTSAAVTVTGIGNFEGNNDSKFTIVAAEKNLASAVVTLENDTIEFDGQPHAAAIKKVTLGDAIITDYVQIEKPVIETNVGEYEVKVVSKPKQTTANTYGGVAVAKFTITAKAAEVDFKLSTTKKTYNGKAQTVTVKDVTRDGVEISEDDYTVSGTTKATDAGKKTVTVTLKGNYSGSAKKTWEIVKAKQTIKVSPTSKIFKASKVKKAKQTFTIKVTGAKGTKSFKSNSKKVTVSKAGKVTVKKGTKKGTYKITVKAAATKNYNAAASKTVTIKVK